MEIYLMGLLGVAAIFIVTRNRTSLSWKLPQQAIPPEWKAILTKEITFYNSLSPLEKEHFEYKVQEFLLNCRITGIQTEVDKG